MDSACRETWDLWDFWDLCGVVKMVKFGSVCDIYLGKPLLMVEISSETKQHPAVRLCLGKPGTKCFREVLSFDLWVVAWRLARLARQVIAKWGGLSRHSQQVPWEGEISVTIRRCDDATMLWIHPLWTRQVSDNWSVTNYSRKTSRGQLRHHEKSGAPRLNRCAVHLPSMSPRLMT